MRLRGHGPDEGGLSRRNTFLNDLRNERGWGVVTIGAGQITDGFGVQEELKFDNCTNAYNLMGYDAIGIGKGITLPRLFPLDFTAPTSATTQSLSSVTLASMVIIRHTPVPSRSLNGGKRIGVTSVVCGDKSTERRDENILYSLLKKKLLELLPTLKKKRATCGS